MGSAGGIASASRPRWTPSLGSAIMGQMFERFTDRSRRVLVLAQEEAKQLHHNFIGTEHILLGLIHEGEGVAARALDSMGVRLADVRQAVLEKVGPMEHEGTGPPPFTPRAKKVLELALREALKLGHNYIGTEHILLGLVAEGEGVAANVLSGLGVELAEARSRVLVLLGGYSPRSAWAFGPSLRRLAGGRADPPRCGICGASLAATARYRDIVVRPAEGAKEEEQPVLRVTFCSTCGTALGSPAILVEQFATQHHLSSETPAPASASARAFPDDELAPVSLDDVPEDSRVELTLTDRRVLDGRAGGEPVQLLGVWSHEGSIEGTWMGEPVRASWTVESSGMTPAPAGDLTGSFGRRGAQLHGAFQLRPDWFFEGGNLTGTLAGQALEAAVQPATGGLGGHTVCAAGKLGDADFDVFVSLSGNHSQAVARGSAGGHRLGLDFTPSAEKGALHVAGEYRGPPELLALLTGAVVYFM